MCKSLFISVNPDFGVCFRIKPRQNESFDDYFSLTKPIHLKETLGWQERRDLQNMLSKADIWDDFPAVGLTLVRTEFKGGDENQRIDLLYLRDDGGLLPCELKIGGQSKDAHGQLIRYMADLDIENLNLAYLKRHAKKFHDNINASSAKRLHEDKLSKFLLKHKITAKCIRLIPGAGILIDEAFPHELLKAVRFLNNKQAFSIRMLRLSAFVAQDWCPGATDYRMRFDFTEIQ